MTTLLLVLASLMIGFAWGFLITFTYMVLPLRTKLKEFVDMTLAFTTDQTNRLTELLSKLPSTEDGSIISPIQIKKDN